MDYKSGDKVRIKTWGEMEKEYGSYREKSISHEPYCFGKNRDSYINKNFPDRIFEIKEIVKDKHSWSFYRMEGANWEWADYMIKYKVDVPIGSRFEILDL